MFDKCVLFMYRTDVYETEEEWTMWNFERNVNTGKAALAGGYREEGYATQSKKFSGSMAMILGLFITIEIMTGGAMLFNFDFHSADIIALLFAFMVLYAGVVAVLTDK